LAEQKLTATVRQASPSAKVIDIQGEITSFSEETLAGAYAQALEGNPHTIILNFSNMTYLNSLGIGMLVTLLIRARREGKRIVGYGLNQHYQDIFELTRVNQVIPIYSTEAIAVASADPMDLPERES